MLEYALTAPLGFYQQADTIVRLLTAENVTEVMTSLPHEVRKQFIQFAREAYVPRGPRCAVSGSVVSEASLDALRAWLTPPPSQVDWCYRLETNSIPPAPPPAESEYESSFANF